MDGNLAWLFSLFLVKLVCDIGAYGVGQPANTGAELYDNRKLQIHAAFVKAGFCFDMGCKFADGIFLIVSDLAAFPGCGPDLAPAGFLLKAFCNDLRK